MRKPNRKAFTLIEFIIVIAVISVLAAVMIPTISGIVRSAHKSADEQELASVNLQLAIADKISNEADLNRAFSNLSPRSAQYGYHYWYDVKNNAVVLKTYSEIAALNNSDEEETVHVESMKNEIVTLSSVSVTKNAEFAENEKNNFRMFKNFFLLDNGGSIIGEALNALSTGADVARKVEALTTVSNSSDNKEMADALVGKIATVAVIGDNMTYVYDPDSVKTIYFAPGIETIATNGYDYIAKTENLTGNIVIPDTVKTIEENALNFDNNNQVTIQTSLNSAEEIAEVFKANSTNATIVSGTDDTYIVDGDTLKDSAGNETVLDYGNPVSSFDIVTPEDTDYFKTITGNLYIAYNYSDAIQLGVGSFVAVNGGSVSSEEVTWSSDNSCVSVAADGNISIVAFPELENCTANITATAVAGGATETLTVQIVRPRNFGFTFASGEHDMTADDGLNIELTYNGDTLDFPFADFSYDLNVEGTVSCDTTVTITAGEGNLFTIDNNILSLISDEGLEGKSQNFTVKVGGALTKTFTVTVKDVSAEPFEVKAPFNAPTFLYRVGNLNAVTLGQFFMNDKPEATSTLTIIDVSRNVAIGYGSNSFTATVNGEASANGTWTITADGWESASIQFSGTGVARISLGEVYVTFEIVDGKNVSAYSEFESGKNLVMLSDIVMSDNGRFALQNATLFGNDFTFDVTKGNYVAVRYEDNYSAISENYRIYLNNGILDNVRILGNAFSGFSATASNPQNICNVLSLGNSKILNCHISYCAAPVRLKEGNLEIINTTLKGGSIANLDIRGGSVILDNVTTINQRSVNGKSDCEGAIGLGIMVWYEGVNSGTTITIKNNLTQFNCMSKDDFKNIPIDMSGVSLSETFANAIFNGTNGTDQFIYEKDGKQWINTGIFSMTEAVGYSNIKATDFSFSNIYAGNIVQASAYGSTFKGYFYSIKSDSAQHKNYDMQYAAAQGIIYPTFSVDNSENNVDKTEGSNEYCYFDNGIIYISFDDGGSKILNISGICAANKGTNALTLSNVYLDGVIITAATITFDASGEHTLTFEFDDAYNYDISGNQNVVKHTKSISIIVSEVEPEAKNAEFTFGSSNLPSESVVIDNITHLSIDKDYITGASIGNITIGGNVIYYPIVEAYTSDGKYSHSSLSSWYMCFPVFKNAITITDYADNGKGSAIVYNASTTSLPLNLSVKGEKAGNYEGGAATAFKYQASTSAPDAPANVSGVLCYKSPTLSNNARSEMNYVIRYQYTDNVGATYYYYIGYHCPETKEESACVTPDTHKTAQDAMRLCQIDII